MSLEDVHAARKLSYLSEVAIFQDLSAEQMEALGRAAPMRQVEAGTTFHGPGDPTEVVFILKKGRVKVYQLSAEGRALTMHLYEAGSIFGEMPLMGQNMQGNYAEALTFVKIHWCEWRG